ncbi:MAG: hypothetical protein JW889_02755 [Verrucomicrobia bacterium]|nr:hypothetical protein [Verrucomicrobiota bacterium]
MRTAVSALLFAALCVPALAGPTKAHLDDLPVREVTVFKDGHAFVSHEGTLEIEDGAVVLEYLPEPVLGTFWAYARGRRVTLESVVAARQQVEESRTAISLADLLRANAGKPVTLSVKRGDEIQDLMGTLAGIPVREAERAITIPARREYDYSRGGYIESPAMTRTETVTERGDVVLVDTEDGLRALPLEAVVSASFPKDAAREYTEPIEKSRLRLNIAGGRGGTTVGITYLQRGLRWIPEYKMTIDGEGKAVLMLQGTLVNDMVDLNDVTVNLIVGVPSFAFKDQLSPLALREAAAQLSQYFQPSSSTAYAFHNAIMSQVASPHAGSGGGGGAPPAGAESLGPREDLFLYKIAHVSLKKGERMIVPVIEIQATYKDVYTWNIPFSPPPELLSNMNVQQREEMMMLASGARARHALRVKNDSEVPLTTGPALILAEGSRTGGQLLAQSLIRYTSVGNEVDVDVTVATDLHTKKWEQQTGREDNAKVINGHNFTRLNMRGFLELTNYKKEPVTVEVTRAVLGTLTESDNDGELLQINAFEDWSYLPEGSGANWRSWYCRWWGNWPSWWHNANDIGQVKWTITLNPGEKRTLGYTWYYYAW